MAQVGRPSQVGWLKAKVGTQWFAVDGDDKPTGEPLDIELAYECVGDPSAAPLLLCNGIAMQGILFGSEFLEALAAAGPYYVIVYDARDCGLSTKVDAAGDPAIVQVFAQKQLGLRQQRKDGIPYFVSCVLARPRPPLPPPPLPPPALPPPPLLPPPPPPPPPPPHPLSPPPRRRQPPPLVPLDPKLLLLLLVLMVVMCACACAWPFLAAACCRSPAGIWPQTPSACWTRSASPPRTWLASQRSAAPPRRRWPSSTPRASPR
jgi:hypothetical protein